MHASKNIKPYFCTTDNFLACNFVLLHPITSASPWNIGPLCLCVGLQAASRQIYASCTVFQCDCAASSRSPLSSTRRCLDTSPATLRGCCLVTNARPRRLRYELTSTLVVSRTRIKFGDRAFSATGPRDLMSGTICRRTCHIAVSDSRWNIFIWPVGPKRSVNLPSNCASKTLLLTCLLTYYLLPKSGQTDRSSFDLCEVVNRNLYATVLNCVWPLFQTGVS